MTKIQKAPKPEEVQATIKKLTQQVLREALEAELENSWATPNTSVLTLITTAMAIVQKL